MISTAAASIALAAVLSVGAAPSTKRINLDVKDADLHNVLRLLADVGRINIVVADDVKGKVTVRLTNVPWTEALDVVLAAKGLGKEKVGSVIHVDTLERIIARDKTRAELAATRQEAAPLVTVMIPVNYTTAESLRPIVQSMLTPRGKVIVDARTNTLIVTDAAENVDRVRSSLGK